MQHVEYKFTGETVEGWLRHTSFDHPRDMGCWSYGFGWPLAMSSGQASLIKVAELLELPCFPIAVDKRMVNGVEERFGYTGHLLSRPLAQPGSAGPDLDRR